MIQCIARHGVPAVRVLERMRGRALPLAWLVVLLVPAAEAADVEVVGLFAGKAVLRIDGRETLLSAGQRAGTVRLLDADSRRARLEIDGAVHDVPLSERVSGRFVRPEVLAVTLVPDARGQYRAAGTVNGASVEFLVDTGASVVALSERQAEALGVQIGADAAVGTVTTAQGQAASWMVRLDAVTVGGITQRQVPAAIVEGDFPTVPLLGMSFLRGVTIGHDGDNLVLSPKP